MSEEKIRLSQAVIVEGKYDKIKLSSIIDALIIPTNGFQIFRDQALLKMIKKIADEHGLIIITDSDSAGMMIRSHLKNTVGSDRITNIFLPRISGKEPRKTKASAEGIVGVEGTPKEIIRTAILNSGIKPKLSLDLKPITKKDLYFAGLSGMDNSLNNRKSFLKFIGLPENLSANYLLDYLNNVFTYEEFAEVCSKWQKAQM